MSRWIETACVVCDAREVERFFSFDPARFGVEVSVVRCRGCGLRWLDPRPLEEELAACSGESYYAYGGRRHAAWKQAVWDLLRDVPRASGCGHRGRSRSRSRGACSTCTSRSTARRRGCSMSAAATATCSSTSGRGARTSGVSTWILAPERPAPATGFRSTSGRSESLALPPASGDVAILQHSLEHIPDARDLVAELARVVRPGGALHIAVPNGASAAMQLERNSCRFRDPLRHVWFFDASTLGSLVGQQGFVPVRVAHHAVWTNHRPLWRRRVPEDGRIRVARAALRLAAEHVRRRDASDVLRLVAERLAQRHERQRGAVV